MSSSHVDISYDLVKGIFAALNGLVIVGTTTYGVYKSVPSSPPDTYVRIGEVIHTEDGTKDDFVYNGTVSIIINDSSSHRADKKLAQSILSKVRSLLKPSKASVFSVSPRSLINFTHNSFDEFITMDSNSKAQIQLIDNYEFNIE